MGRRGNLFPPFPVCRKTAGKSRVHTLDFKVKGEEDPLLEAVCDEPTSAVGSLLVTPTTLPTVVGKDKDEVDEEGILW